jgi:ribosomal protein S6
LERFYKLNEFCLRYLTVVSEGKAQPEEQEQKMEEAQTDSSSSN